MVSFALCATIMGLRRVERVHLVVISRGEVIVNKTSTTLGPSASIVASIVSWITTVSGKVMNEEVSSTVRCDRYPFYFRLSPKLDKICLYNTKLTSREIEPFFLAMIPEDLEAKKHILFHI